MPATTSQQALQELQQYQQGIKSPTQAITDAQQGLGVNTAQQQVQGLRGAINQTSNLLNQVAPSVMGRTQNSLVTSAQAGRIIGNEQQPIQENLQKLGTNYNQANSDYESLQRQADQRANAELAGQQGQQSYLQSIYQNLSGAEQRASDEAFRNQQAAEDRRQFDAGVSVKRAEIAAANPGLSLGSGGSATTQPFQISGDPSQAVKQLFQGYAPGQHAYYTENTVIPKLRELLRSAPGNAPYSGQKINEMAKDLAYQYRKQNFGE